ncbi:Crp/Fnr family transcriptional regulator [Thiohalobacter thiocyanaticus]|uniref:Crp/Fnr family transcriptional regulator n=1 Tax=Thiohalobacter thiocyanaticus TaxID=585455 RepID=UPI00131A2FB4|nr:cyclic nucleotide-binding domain-containing protein [Thiohalobacter thiocyanaticus]
MVQSLQTLLQHPAFVEGVQWRRAEYPANHCLFRAGEPGGDIFVLLSGAVRVTGNVSLDDERHIRPGVCDLESGAVFGELALFDAGPRSASVTTLTPVELAVIDGAELLRFFEAHPDTGYMVLREIIEMLVARLRLTNDKVWSLLAWGPEGAFHRSAVVIVVKYPTGSPIPP